MILEVLLAIGLTAYELAVYLTLALLTLLFVGALVWVFDRWLMHGSVTPAPRVCLPRERPVDFAAAIDDHLRAKDRYLEDVDLRRAA